MVGTEALDGISAPPDSRAAKEGLAHRVRETAVLDFEGSDGIAFLQGQLTQDDAVASLRARLGRQPR